MFDHIRGSACTNCESYPAGYLGSFCSTGCRDEWEGIGEYWEPDWRPVRNYTMVPGSRLTPSTPTADDNEREAGTGELFTRTELQQGEALRQWKAAQVPGQVDIWDACAEVAAEQTDEVPAAWPQPEGVLFDAEQMRGQLVIA